MTDYRTRVLPSEHIELVHATSQQSQMNSAGDEHIGDADDTMRSLLRPDDQNHSVEMNQKGTYADEALMEYA